MFRQVLFFIFLLTYNFSTAQEIHVKGEFLADSIKIGQPLSYSLRVVYPKASDIIFPDSTYDFSPFEFDSKSYISTVSDSVYSYDSAVFTLLTFEIDSVQRLSLPVFELISSDSISHYATSDSVILKHVVESVPDTLQAEEVPLKENPNYIPFLFRFNYPYLIIGIVIFLIAAILGVLIFGKSVRKWWKLRKLKKYYSSYLDKFNATLAGGATEKQKAEEIENLWKSFMQKTISLPYKSFTTKEIIRLEKDTDLETALRNLYKIIYSSEQNDENFLPAAGKLKDYSEHIYHQREETIRNE